MRIRSAPIVLILVLAVLLPVAPAGAAKQLKAGKAPKVAGPLEQVGRACDSQTVRAGGRVLARVEACVFFFAFDSFSELNVLRDYGVAWAQLTFDAGRGFCANQIGVVLEFPEGTEVHQSAPERAIVGRRAQRAQVRLEGIAGTFSLEESSVSQRLTAIPSSLRSTAEPSRVSIEWIGHTGAKIAIVGGAEVSWSVLTPLEEFDMLPGGIQMTQC